MLVRGMNVNERKILWSVVPNRQIDGCVWLVWDGRTVFSVLLLLPLCLGDAHWYILDILSNLLIFLFI